MSYKAPTIRRIRVDLYRHHQRDRDRDPERTDQCKHPFVKDLLRGTVARGKDSSSYIEVQMIDTIAHGKAYEDTHKAVGEKVRSDIHTAVDYPGDQEREYRREASVSKGQAEEGSHCGIVRRVPREEAIEFPW